MEGEDTIAAISTPIGQAGIGIIRISGPLSLSILKNIFIPKRETKGFKSHHLYLGNIYDPTKEAIIDEVLVSYMKAPHSYTKEDVVEINSHSGYLVLSKILEIILSQGARLAKPGEFTLKAFLNGRIDLTQAEAIIDLINAQSERGLFLATHQLQGVFKKEINSLKDKITDILAQIEVAIDFPEEEDAVISRLDIAQELEKDIIPHIESMIHMHSQRRLWLDGIATVIVGKVNAGKSSLLNRLLDEERAIVTPIPGTTRDVIESSILIKGLPIRLMDTAGLREVKDEVEKIGISITTKKLREADLVLIVIDKSRPLDKDDLDIIEMCKDKSCIFVLNKTDLRSSLNHEDKARLMLYSFPMVHISALTGKGLEELKSLIFDTIVKGKIELTESNIAPNLRHKEALENALKYLISALHLIKEGEPFDIIAFEIRSSMDALAQITGEITTEDILDKIFSQFCLGK